MTEITIRYDEICIFRTTDKAWAVCWGSTYNGKCVFLPKSQVEVDETMRMITLPEWLAIDKGLECYYVD